MADGPTDHSHRRHFWRIGRFVCGLAAVMAVVAVIPAVASAAPTGATLGPVASGPVGTTLSNSRITFTPNGSGPVASLSYTFNASGTPSSPCVPVDSTTLVSNPFDLTLPTTVGTHTLRIFAFSNGNCSGNGATPLSITVEVTTGYFVTFAARSCPSYDVIFGNIAHNNIQESLEPLTRDTQYPPGIRVSPAYEDLPPQNVCDPITGWQFKLGTGYQTRVDTGDWGSMSRVTNPFPTSIVTKASTPELDDNGAEVPGRTIDGAVTIELTPEELAQASTPDQLWAQGGIPGDPVLASNGFPGPEFAFGTLRCATDNLNGDNVEFVYFPTGVKHVFCYAFYVKPPPTSGTITIKKAVEGAPAGASPSFLFTGDLSFDASGFTLADGGDMRFYRAGGRDWSVTEQPVDGYALQSIDCGSANVTVSGATVTIHLAARDNVTCTFTNRYIPPTGGLAIFKTTRGGVGTFTYAVRPVSGQGGGVRRVTATTTTPGVPDEAAPSLTDLPPGTYRIVEHAPRTPDGRWRRTSASCNGARRSGSIEVTIVGGKNVTCQFTNTFKPKGSISLSKITKGATGSVVFQIERLTGTPAQFVQTATTTHEGVAAAAVPKTPADATNRLRLGTYEIIEQAPLSTEGTWTLTSVECDGTLMPFDEGSTVVRLTSRRPHAHCVYTDTFTPHPIPEPPPGPEEPLPPGPDIPAGPNPDEPSTPWTDLAVTKTATPSPVAVGNVVTYRITVTNHGPNDAERVVLDDRLFTGATVVSVRSDVGRCRVGAPLTCDLGTLKPDAAVHVTLRLRVNRSSPGLTNRAVVGTATTDPNLANNVAHATIRVVAPPRPVVTG